MFFFKFVGTPRYSQFYNGNYTLRPGEFDQLTVNGKRQMFEIGLYLRRRYVDFLSANTGEVYAISSDKNR